MTEQAIEVEEVSIEEFAKRIDEVLEWLQGLAETDGPMVDISKRTASVISTMAAVIDELQKRLMAVHYASQWQLTLTRPKEESDGQA